MKRKSRDWDLTLELSCHAGCPTAMPGIIATDKKHTNLVFVTLSQILTVTVQL
jgi:hypothetical protein